MRKLLVLLASMMVIASLSGYASAGTTGDCFITTTAEEVSITMTYSYSGEWAIGTQGLSSSHWTNSTTKEYFNASNDGNVAEDFNIKIQDDTPTWFNATTPGAEQYRLNWSLDNWTTNGSMTTVYQALVTSVVAGTNRSFDLRFDLPTSTSDYTQQNITIRLQAVKA